MSSVALQLKLYDLLKTQHAASLHKDALKPCQRLRGNSQHNDTGKGRHQFNLKDKD